MYPVSRSFFFVIPACAESFDRVTDIPADSLFTPGETANKPTTRVSTSLTLKKRKEKPGKKQWKERKMRCPMNQTSTTIDKLSKRDRQY